MSMQAGQYKGKVIGVALEAIGADNHPVLKVTFQPYSFMRGSVYVEGDYRVVDKLYFLSTGLVTKGKNAGLGQMEVLRKELAEVYEHRGDLDEQAMGHIFGKDFDLVVELNKNGYPQVKYVNKPGGKGSPKGKALPADFLARLQAAFKGEAPKPQPTPSNFFQDLGVA